MLKDNNNDNLEPDSEIIEGCWDCPADPVKHDHNNVVVNKGTALYCCECQTERPKDVKFYLPDDLSNQQRFNEAGKPDWRCQFCNNYNRFDEIICIHCNEHREDEDQPGIDLKEGNWEYNGSSTNLNTGYIDSDPDLNNIDSNTTHGNTMNGYNNKERILFKMSPSTTTVSKNKNYLNIVILLTLCFSIFIIYNLFHKSKIDLNLIQMKWETSTIISADVVLYGEGFELPFNDYVIIRQEEKLNNYIQVKIGQKKITKYRTKRVSLGKIAVKKSKRVKVGSKRVKSGFRTKNLGNGKFRKEIVYTTKPIYKTKYYTEQQEKFKNIKEPYTVIVDDFVQKPIYKTYYYWQYIEHQQVDNIKKRGNKGSPLEWSKIPSKYANPMMSRGKTLYFLIFEDDNKKQYTISVNKSIWNTYKIGKKYSAMVNKIGLLSDIKLIE